MVESILMDKVGQWFGMSIHIKVIDNKDGSVRIDLDSKWNEWGYQCGARGCESYWTGIPGQDKGFTLAITGTGFPIFNNPWSWPVRGWSPETIQGQNLWRVEKEIFNGSTNVIIPSSGEFRIVAYGSIKPEDASIYQFLDIGGFEYPPTCAPSIETSEWVKVSEDGCYDIYQRTITTTNTDCSSESIIEEDRRYSDILCPPTVTSIVKLETVPSGATIVIGGHELVSPATIDLEPGTYEVIISLGGHETIRETIIVRIGETTPLVVSMEKAPSIVPKVIAGAVLSIGLYGLIRKLKK